MNKITDELLRLISDFKENFQGAFSIRENGGCAARQSTEHIQITNRKDGLPGLEVHIQPGTRGEKVYIPACVTQGGIDDLVYNDFYVGEGADVIIVAGCGVHNEEDTEAKHNGIHRFYLAEGSHVLYQEKHIATGAGSGAKRINPVTDAHLQADACLEMDTVQLRGVDTTLRKTTAVLEDRARIVVRERLLTDGEETAKTEFEVTLRGEDSGADLVSRSVARGNSHQDFVSIIRGENRCTGHSECDAILADNGRVDASPALQACHIDAALIHEAAIGKIAGEQILKLRTLGLTEEEAEEKIIEGFLK